MVDDQQCRDRRGWVVTAGRLALTGAVAPALASTLPGWASEVAADEATGEQAELTAGKVVDALEGASGVRRRQRRNHTKSVSARGLFLGSSVAAAYSRSALFSGEALEVVARFSLAGGDPDASDAERSPRGLALKFLLPNGRIHHITMINTPMFVAAVPQTLRDEVAALATDRTAGKPDAAKHRAFEATHPESAGQAAFLRDNNPPPSYANCAYYGIHAFRFINRGDVLTNVCYRFVPWDGERQLSDAELEAMPRDFLKQALMERVARGPVGCDMVLTIGEPGNPTDNPTVLWPTDRKEIQAGTLAITSATPYAVAGSYGINIGPLVLADGIVPAEDAVLLFRSPSYATSHTRRLRRL
jgi:catalase